MEPRAAYWCFSMPESFQMVSREEDLFTWTNETLLIRSVKQEFNNNNKKKNDKMCLNRHLYLKQQLSNEFIR